MEASVRVHAEADLVDRPGLAELAQRRQRAVSGEHVVAEVLGWRRTRTVAVVDAQGEAALHPEPAEALAETQPGSVAGVVGDQLALLGVRGQRLVGRHRLRPAELPHEPARLRGDAGLLSQVPGGGDGRAQPRLRTTVGVHRRAVEVDDASRQSRGDGRVGLPLRGRAAPRAGRF